MMDNNQDMMMKGHKMKGWLVIILGLTFLAQALGYITWNTVNIIWPILLICVGVKKLMKK